MKEMLDHHYGYLFEDELLKEILEKGKELTFSKGDIIIDYDQKIEYMPLLLEGAIKVLRTNEKDQELVLYFLEQGDTCTMTMNCCMGEMNSEICAISETDSHLILIPVIYMKKWLKKYNSWMSFVMMSYQNRFNELLGSIDGLAFGNLNDRLLTYLKDQVYARHKNDIVISHEQIAIDLNTSRVVISRLLKNLENNGVIKQTRGMIELLNI